MIYTWPTPFDWWCLTWVIVYGVRVEAPSRLLAAALPSVDVRLALISTPPPCGDVWWMRLLKARSEDEQVC